MTIGNIHMIEDHPSWMVWTKYELKFKNILQMLLTSGPLILASETNNELTLNIVALIYGVL